MSRKSDHIVIDTRTAEWHCKRCGDRLAMNFPMCFSVLEAVMKAYLKDHINCKKRANPPLDQQARK